ncbi:hypothetical protein [Maribellus sediminis]|uniref:hypothetical protein n=1 Tax=Maribellus sediminis TaxID=2696285 RepID=UPI0014309BB2|nr:hypothetical protein [Maribellus sediminis]
MNREESGTRYGFDVPPARKSIEKFEQGTVFVFDFKILRRSQGFFFEKYVEKKGNDRFVTGSKPVV